MFSTNVFVMLPVPKQIMLNTNLSGSMPEYLLGETQPVMRKDQNFQYKCQMGGKGSL